MSDIEPLTQDMIDGLRLGTVLSASKIAILNGCSARWVRRAMAAGQLRGFKLEQPSSPNGYWWCAYDYDVIQWAPRDNPMTRKGIPHTKKKVTTKNCPADAPGPKEADVRKGMALFEEQRRRRAEAEAQAAASHPRPRHEFGADVRPVQP